MPKNIHWAGANNGLLFSPDSSCVLWLPGQDDAYSATIRDRSGNGNNGAITGATWKRTGQGLWYLDSDGTDDYVDCGNSSTLNPAQMTILCWARWSVSTANKAICGWWENAQADVYSYVLRANAGLAGKPDWIIKDSGGNQAITWTGASLADNVWHFIAARADGSNIKLRVDTTDVTPVAAGNIVASSDKFVTHAYGLSSAGGANYHDIDIDLLRIFNSSLIDSQMADFYQQERHLFGV